MAQKSAELLEMIATGKGYRNPNYGGAQIINLEEILWHEIGDMGNSDVLDFMIEHCGLEVDYLAKPEDSFTPEELDNLPKTEIESVLREETGHIFFENYASYVEKILDNLESKLGTRKLYGLWLTTREGVKRYCGKGSAFIDEYQITDKTLPISDLRGDGTLFVYTQGPDDYILDSVLHEFN